MPAEANNEQSQDKKRGLPILTIGVILAVAVLEAGVFFVALKWFGGDAELAYGESGEHLLEENQVAEVKTAEVALLKGFRVPNDKDGRLRIYDIDVTVVVPADNEVRHGEIVSAIEERRAELSDRAAQIIRSAGPRVMNEDDYRTLRHQFQRAFTDVLRDPDAVVRVLIPRCVPMRGF
jgi:flagellar basal body-associated protein FliL